MNPIRLLLMSRCKVYRSDCPDKGAWAAMSFNAEEALGTIIEEWKRDGFEQPWDLSIKKLGVKIIEALERAYTAGQEQAIAYFNEHKDDGSTLPDDDEPEDFEDYDFFDDDEEEADR